VADIREIRERADEARAAWAEILREGSVDARYLTGDPWPPEERRQRELAKRPVLAFDELNQYVNQIINDVRANPRAIIVTPVGNGANDETARLYQDLIRDIEYRSKAHVAYTTAFQSAIERGYGYVRVTAKWDDDASFNQSLWIESVPNPDAVLLDPGMTMPDGSDAEYAFVFKTMRRETFQRQFPKASLEGWDPAVASQWLGEDTVTVAEYWYREVERQRVLAVTSPDGTEAQVVPAEAFDRGSGWRVVRERDVERHRVSQCLTNGQDVLARSDWAGKYIPIAACFGKIIYVDRGRGPERFILSMVRLARDPFMLYCYYRTCEAELIGMTPKFPYFVYEGQLSPEEHLKLQRSLHEPVSVVRVRPYVEGVMQLLPPPTRQPYEPPIAQIEAGAESARRAIQAAMGTMPLPTQMQAISQKSGAALKRIDAATQRGAFHFVDHYDLMIQHVGTILEDLIDKVYDTARDLTLRDAYQHTRVVRVNDPTVPKPISTQGTHQVTVSAGPSFESEREAASAFADQLAANPEIFRLIGPMVVKLKNLGPIGDDIAKALEVLQPPELRPQAQQADPRAVAMLRQAEAMIEGLSKRVQELQAMIDAQLVREMAETERQKMRIASQQQIEALRAQIRMLLETIRGKATIERDAIAALTEREVERDRDAREFAMDEARRLLAQGGPVPAGPPQPEPPPVEPLGAEEQAPPPMRVPGPRVQ
jgi:hypothetical protein